MKEKITFDAVINANNAIVIPQRTRLKNGLDQGDAITVQIIDIIKKVDLKHE